MNLALCTSFLIVFAVYLRNACGRDGLLGVNSLSFPYHVDLDENFQLKWDYNSSHIVFETHVKTNGYIAFGFSETGDLYPADFMVGWVREGEVHFADRHTDRHLIPYEDRSQDWFLINGSESGNYTTLTMIRRLDTCDCQDMAIKEGTIHVLFRYYPSDPLSDDNFPYHGDSVQGEKTMFLLDPPTKDWDPKPLPRDVFTIDVLNQNYSVPSSETTYACSIWKLPPLVGKHHVIKFEPVIQEGHEDLLIHMMLYFCSEPIDESLVGTTFHCFSNSSSASGTSSCRHAFMAWAKGATGSDFPDHVGFSLGSSGDPVYFKIQTHYQNGLKRSDLVDNSGLRMYLTKQVRQFDGAILEAGIHVGPHHIIPPYDIYFKSQGFCNQGCLAEALGDTQMHVFANALQAHALGTKLRTRIIRNGVELPPLQEDNNFDSNFHDLRILSKERIIKKGDTLIVECVYDSSQRTTVTYGGLGTTEEMCVSFLFYYPRSNLSTCSSWTQHFIPYKFQGKTDAQIAEIVDWSKQEIQDAYVKSLWESDEHNICLGSDKEYEFHGSVTPKVNVTQPYQYPQTCPINI